MPDGKRDLLWRIVTKQEFRPQKPEELYVRLASQVFDQSAAKELALRSGEPSDEKKLLIDRYVDKPVDERYLTAYDESRAVGSDYIREMKSTHREDPKRLTYEHLLADRMCAPIHNIVLIGPTGSGKTYKLLFVNHKYVWNLSHCPDRKVDTECATKQRVKIRVDIDEAKCTSVDDFHDKVFLAIVAELENQLRRLPPGHVQQHYTEFIKWMFKPGHALPPFLQALWADGLTSEAVRLGKIPSLSDVRTSCLAQDHRREAVLLALRFCGWLRDGKCARNAHCLYVEFDNVDTSPPKVQDALVSLLEDTDPKYFALLVCACRHETFSRWTGRRELLDMVQHTGPSAYEVMMHDLGAFLQRYRGLQDDSPQMEALRSALLNKSPREFLDNLTAIREEFRGVYWRVLWERLFGQQIRAGLLFACSVVEVAAAHSPIALRSFLEEKSVYALERLLYRPRGMNSPVPQMENVYALSPEPRHRLLGVRTLELLNSHERYQLSVKDVCEYLRPVAEYKDSVGCLNRLIECELVLADEREHAELDANDPSPKVKLRLTDTGVGVLGVCYTYNYLSCQMYFTPCDTSASKYPAYSAEERAGEATLETTFSTLRVFLRETADIETDDIKRALKYLETHPDDEAARNADGGLLLGLRMPCLYEETVAAAGRIAMAPRSKAAVDSALNFTDEYEAWRNEMRLLEGVTLPEHGKEYRSMLARLAEEASDPAEPAGGGGPVGGGTAKYHRYHRHSDWHGTQK